LDSIFGHEARPGDIVWKNSSKNDEDYVSMQHEYILSAVKDANVNKGVWKERKEGLDEIYKAFAGFKRKFGLNAKAIHEAALEWFNTFPESNPIRDSKHYSWMDHRGVYFPDNISGPNFGQYVYDVYHPITEKKCKPPASGWRFPETKMLELIEDKRVHFGDDESTVPNNKTYLKDTEFQSLTSIKYRDGRVASKLLKRLFGTEAFKNPKDPDLTARLLRSTTSSRDVILDYFAGSGTTGHAIVELNREDNAKEEGTGRRKWILAEMGEYFESVTKPRMQKVVHSRKWKDGKPEGREGISQCFKTIRLESYEDVLNNLQVHKASAELFGNGKDGFAEDHLLHYALDVESRESLLNVRSFADPFNYRLRITRHNEVQEERIDLVETFNYLIGLVVHHRQWMSGFHVVTGALLSGEKVLIIWRNTTEKDNTALEAFFKKRQYNPRDTEFDLIYVNGDNTLENLRTEPEHWKVRLIEEEFLKRMWEGKDV
jgi:hypothetical protein